MKRLFKNTDFLIIGIVITLSIIGILGIYSAGHSSYNPSYEYIKQIIWVVTGFIIMAIMWMINYKNTATIGYFVYFLSTVLLILVLFTSPINGAKSWFNLGFSTFQPSEFMKIAYILVAAKAIEYMLNKNKNYINSFKGIFIIFALFIIPVSLISIQPDFGTSLVFISITFFMLFKAGLNYKYILLILLIALILIPVIYTFFLNSIQQERILVFFNPERDPLGSGYNAIQSKLAVGSGMMFGTGLLKGTQTQFGYLPVKSTDFIYSVISEEMGFVISTLIIILYVILLLRILQIASTTENTIGSTICMGIFGMIFFHFIENIGMTIGLMPITGIPLPFLSYGGSSTIVNFISIGIVLSISARRKTTLF